MPTEEFILVVENVWKEFAGSPPVLAGVSRSFRRGSSTAIVGPSGSGKSTLLNILGTLDQPTRGKVRLEGQDLGDRTESEVAEIRNRQIGFVFQAHYLLPQCTVLENVLVPTLARKDADRAESEKRARRLLERVGLGARLGYRPAQLSGGERQRTAVVRSLINEPHLLLADEPTGALDRASAQNLVQLLVELNREEQVTMIVVSHALDLARRFESVLELRDGQLHSWHAAAESSGTNG